MPFWATTDHNTIIEDHFLGEFQHDSYSDYFLPSRSATPAGSAGGDLEGDYPNPRIRSGVIGNGHLDNDIAVGSLATLTTLVSTSITGALNWLHALIQHVEDTFMDLHDETNWQLSTHIEDDIATESRLGHVRGGGDIVIDTSGVMSLGDATVTAVKIRSAGVAAYGKVLTYDVATGGFLWVDLPASSVNGSGQAGRVAYWTGTNTIGFTRAVINGAKGMFEVPYATGDLRPAIYGGDPDNALSNRVGVYGGSYLSYGTQGFSWEHHGGYFESANSARAGAFGNNSTGVGLWGEGAVGVRGRSLNGTCIHVQQPSGSLGTGLYMQGSERRAQTIVTGNYTILATDNELLVDTRNVTITITVPDASSHPGKVWRIFDVACNANTRPITIRLSGGDAFWDGVASKVINVLGDGAEIRIIENPVFQYRRVMIHQYKRML